MMQWGLHQWLGTSWGKRGTAVLLVHQMCRNACFVGCTLAACGCVHVVGCQMAWHVDAVAVATDMRGMDTWDTLYLGMGVVLR